MTSRIESRLGGAILQETFTSTEGNEVLRSFTYDRFRKRYRITEVNERQTYMDVLEGDFDDQKRFVVSDVTTGTTAEGFGMTFHGRLTILEITPDGFRMEEDYSTDGGKQWVTSLKATYTRRK